MREGDELSALTFGKNADYLLSVGSEAMVHQRSILGIMQQNLQRKRKRDMGLKSQTLYFSKKKKMFRGGKEKRKPQIIQEVTFN